MSAIVMDDSKPATRHRSARSAGKKKPSSKRKQPKAIPAAEVIHRAQKLCRAMKAIAAPHSPSTECVVQPTLPPQSEREEFQEIVRRASEGDAASHAQLRSYLDERPDILQKFGDASNFAERNWISRIAKGNALLEVSLQRKAAENRAQLMAGATTPLQKMLAGMIVVRILAAEYAENTAAEPNQSSKGELLSLRRAESAQKRLASGIKLLALLKTHCPSA